MAALQDDAVEVFLKYFAALRELTGQKEDRLRLRGQTTLKDVVDELAKKYGQKFTDYVLDSEGELREHLSLLVNGEAIDPTTLRTRHVRDQDEIVILPPVGGGSLLRVRS